MVRSSRGKYLHRRRNAKGTIHREIKQLSDGYDDVIIDGPPRVAEVAPSVIMAADLIVVPLQPSPMDVWAAAETIDLINEAKIYRPDLRTCLLVNRKINNTAIGRDVREALADLDVPVLKSDIVQRVAFAESAAAGQTVVDSRNHKAAKEIEKLVDELKRTYE